MSAHFDEQGREVTTVTEWMVETEQTEDEFEDREQEARDWLARCETDPDWMPARLMKRTVTTTTTAWERAR